MNTSNISAIELGSKRIEYSEPNLTLGFAALAPLVSAAEAHLKHNAVDEAKKLLKEACDVITMATQTMCIFKEDAVEQCND